MSFEEHLLQCDHMSEFQCQLSKGSQVMNSSRISAALFFDWGEFSSVKRCRDFTPGLGQRGSTWIGTPMEYEGCLSKESPDFLRESPQGWTGLELSQAKEGTCTALQA